VKRLYRDQADYAKKVDDRLARLVKDGWFLPEYVSLVSADVSAPKVP